MDNVFQVQQQPTRFVCEEAVVVYLYIAFSDGQTGQWESYSHGMGWDCGREICPACHH